MRRALQALHTQTPVDLDDAEGYFRARLTDWQGVLRAETEPARKILEGLLTGRLVLTPHAEEAYYDFKGAATLGRVLFGEIPSLAVVTPAGFDRQG